MARRIARREVLGLCATAAGAAVAAVYLPPPLSRMSARGRALAARAATALGPAAAGAATTPSCIVRPEQTEGPYFVDERLARSDIRSDPSDGSVKEGVKLTLSFVLGRINGSACVPFPGVLIDVWHCDALGIYSDVSDPSFDTTGQRFLRGYQVTDADGKVTFVTIYPGWYQGRTVHIHWKLRTDPDASTGLEFTSQLYFDEGVTDAVHAQQPYASEGERTLRNAGDGIYQSGGSQLLITPVSDGSGGYAATFEVGVETSITSGTGTTTTTLPGSACASIAACVLALEGVLPAPADAGSRRERRTARKLQRRMSRISNILERAAAGDGQKQSRGYAKARAQLQELLDDSEAADARGTLGVELAPLAAAVAALLSQLP